MTSVIGLVDIAGPWRSLVKKTRHKESRSLRVLLFIHIHIVIASIEWQY